MTLARQDDCKVVANGNCLNQDYQDSRMLRIETVIPEILKSWKS